MAALDFPASPSSGQRYSANGSTWEWNGSAWIKLATSSGPTDQVTTANDISTAALYPVMVDGAGDNKALKVSTSKLKFDASAGGLTVISGVGTVTAGIGSTALIVDGDARVLGILTVGSGTVKIDGAGITASGIVTSTEGVTISSDSKHLKIGAHSGGDLLAYHDGNKSVIVNYTGDFHLRTNNGSRSSREGIILKPNGSSEIYYSGSKKIETTNVGAVVTGILTATDFSGTGGGAADFPNGLTGTTGNFTSDVTVGGVLTYEDVRNIDSVGIVTARAGIRVTGGKIGIGTDNPSGSLGVWDASGSDPTMSLHHSNADVEGEIIRVARTDLNTIRYHSIKAKHGGAVTNNYINFALHNGGSGGGYTEQTDVLRIVGNGNVGINTNNPANRLTVWADVSDTDTDVFQIRGKTGAFNIRVNDADAANPEWAIRTYASEPIVFMQGTQEKARLHSDGRVGIGSAIPAARLDVVDTSALGIISRSATTQATNTNKALKVRNNSTDNTFSVSYRGRGYFADRLGIGTESPQSELHFFSDAPVIKVEPTNWQSGLRVDVLGMGNNASNGQLFRIQKDNATKFQINEDGDAIVYGDDNAELKLQCGTTTGNNIIGFINSAGTTKGNIFYDSDHNFMVFKTNGTASANERLRIDSAGRLLYGTTSSTRETSLQLVGNSNSYTTNPGVIDLFVGNTPSNLGSMGQICFGTQDKVGARIDGRADQDWTLNSARGTHLRFLTCANGSTSLTERLRIDSSGTLILKNNSGMMMDLQSSAGTGSAWIEFSDTDGTRKGYFGYGSSSSEKAYWVQSKAAEMTMYSNGNDRFTVQSNGNKIVKNGRLNILSTFIDFSGSISTPQTAAAIFRPEDNTLAFSTANEERLRIASNGDLTNTLQDTCFITTKSFSNLAKLDIRGTNIENSNHYILSYGEGHANDHEFHMVNTIGDLVFRTGTGSFAEKLRITSGGQLQIDQGTSGGNSFKIKNDEISLLAGVNGTGDTYAREAFFGSTRVDSGSYPFTRIAGQGGIRFCVDANNERVRIDSSGTVHVFERDNYNNTAIVQLQDNVIGGARISVSSETMSSDISMPRKGCILAITSFTSYDTYPQPVGTGFVYIDMGASKLVRVMFTQSGTGADATSNVGTALAGYNGNLDTTVSNYTDDKITIATGSADGTFRIVNRTDSAYVFTCTFL